MANATDVLTPRDARTEIFGGTKIVDVELAGPEPRLVLVRPKSFPAEPSGGTADVRLSSPSSPDGPIATVVERHAEAASGPKLEEASVVIAGGRGLGGPEPFSVLDELAAAIGDAAVGASRAAVDAGWVPYAYQIGQTGKTVKPEVYLAVGISGALQHVVGMKGAKRIVAINKDAEAPILKIADLGVVGDLFQIVPALTEEVRKRAELLSAVALAVIVTIAVVVFIRRARGRWALISAARPAAAHRRCRPARGTRADPGARPAEALPEGAARADARVASSGGSSSCSRRSSRRCSRSWTRTGPSRSSGTRRGSCSCRTCSRRLWRSASGIAFYIRKVQKPDRFRGSHMHEADQHPAHDPRDRRHPPAVERDPDRARSDLLTRRDAGRERAVGTSSAPGSRPRRSNASSCGRTC